MGFKTTKATIDEASKIRENMLVWSLDKLAKELNRPIPHILNHKYLTDEEKDILLIKNKLRLNLEYQELKSQLSENELNFFERKYVQWHFQFKYDTIMPTEESSIFLAIKTEILINRCLEEQKSIDDKSKHLESLLTKLRAEIKAEDIEKLTALYDNLSGLRAAKGAKLSDFSRLSKQHQEILAGLKANRDQRIKIIESQKKTYVDLIKAITIEAFAQTEGKQNELIKLATQREKERLQTPHKFMDGELDYPLITNEIEEIKE